MIVEKVFVVEQQKHESWNFEKKSFAKPMVVVEGSK